jgi:hypothetical protein
MKSYVKGVYCQESVIYIINDYRLKSSILIGVEVLYVTGRKKDASGRNPFSGLTDRLEPIIAQGTRIHSSHGYRDPEPNNALHMSGMDSIQMSISIIDCPCSSSVLSAKNDFFYRFNEKISQSEAIGWIEFVGALIRLIAHPLTSF